MQESKDIGPEKNNKEYQGKNMNLKNHMINANKFSSDTKGKNLYFFFCLDHFPQGFFEKKFYGTSDLERKDIYASRTLRRFI